MDGGVTARQVGHVLDPVGDEGSAVGSGSVLADLDHVERAGIALVPVREHGVRRRIELVKTHPDVQRLMNISDEVN